MTFEMNQGGGRERVEHQEAQKPVSLAKHVEAVHTWADFRTVLDEVRVVSDGKGGTLPVQVLYEALLDQTDGGKQSPFVLPEVGGIAGKVQELLRDRASGDAETVFLDILRDRYVRGVGDLREKTRGIVGFLRSYTSSYREQHDSLAAAKQRYLRALSRDEAGFDAWRQGALPYTQSTELSRDDPAARRLYSLEKSLELEAAVNIRARQRVPSWWGSITKRFNERRHVDSGGGRESPRNSDAPRRDSVPYTSHRGTEKALSPTTELEAMSNELAHPVQQVPHWRAVQSLHYTQAQQLGGDMGVSLVRWVESLAQRMAVMSGVSSKEFLPRDEERMMAWLDRVRHAVDAAKDLHV